MELEFQRAIFQKYLIKHLQEIMEEKLKHQQAWACISQNNYAKN